MWRCAPRLSSAWGWNVFILSASWALIHPSGSLPIWPPFMLGLFIYFHDSPRCSFSPFVCAFLPPFIRSFVRSFFPCPVSRRVLAWWWGCDLRSRSGFAAGIYTTNSAEACLHCALNGQADIIVVEDRKQLEKILSIKDQIPTLKAIVQYTGKPHVEGVITVSWLMPPAIFKKYFKSREKSLTTTLTLFFSNILCLFISIFNDDDDYISCWRLVTRALPPCCRSTSGLNWWTWATARRTTSTRNV